MNGIATQSRGRGNKFFFLSLRERMKVRVFMVKGEA